MNIGERLVHQPLITCITSWFLSLADFALWLLQRPLRAQRVCFCALRHWIQTTAFMNHWRFSSCVINALTMGGSADQIRAVCHWQAQTLPTAPSLTHSRPFSLRRSYERKSHNAPLPASEWQKENRAPDSFQPGVLWTFCYSSLFSCLFACGSRDSSTNTAWHVSLCC